MTQTQAINSAQIACFSVTVGVKMVDLKNFTFSDQRRKRVSRFGLAIGLSFVVLSVVLFNISFKTPLFQGLHRFGSRSNSTFLSWPFSSSSTSTFSSALNDTSIVRDSHHPAVALNETLEETTDPESRNFKNGSFVVRKERGRDGSQSDKNSFVSYLVDSSEKNESINVKENTLQGEDSGENTLVNSVEEHNKKGLKNEASEDKIGYLNSNISSYKECDIFNGRWVRDDKKPYYTPGSCPYVDKDFDCLVNGRPDDMFVKWKWQPYGCDIPTFNATDFLERLKGKKLVFVGDSLNRNMWESLVCLLRHSISDKKRVYEISGRSEFKKKGFYAFRFEDYNCSVDFVSSPFFVKESTFNGKNVSFETLRLDLMDEITAMYRDADVIVFNTGHWWTHEKTSHGENYYQEGNYVYPRLKVMEAYKRALVTWAHWVDSNIDERRTQIVFRGFSATHFRGGPWNSGGLCHKEIEPIFKKAHLAKYPAKMKVFERILEDMKTPVIYLNISRITDYRKDGHPSIYRPDYQAGQQYTATVHAQDCSHWCLPGVPDTWNELLYVSLLKSGKGSWRD